MAQTTIRLKLIWENNKSFVLESKEDNDAPIIVVQMDENAHLNEIWEHVQEIGLKYMRQLLGRIGSEMKS